MECAFILLRDQVVGTLECTNTKFDIFRRNYLHVISWYKKTEQNQSDWLKSGCIFVCMNWIVCECYGINKQKQIATLYAFGWWILLRYVVVMYTLTQTEHRYKVTVTVLQMVLTGCRY